MRGGIEMRQAGKKAVSLLLAAQMLGGPISQAASLSPELPLEELPLTSSSPAPEPTTNTGGLEPEVTDVVTPEPTETEVPPEETPVDVTASPAPTEDIPPEEPTQEEPSEETESEEKQTEPEIINLLEQMLQAEVDSGYTDIFMGTAYLEYRVDTAKPGGEVFNSGSMEMAVEKDLDVDNHSNLERYKYLNWVSDSNGIYTLDQLMVTRPSYEGGGSCSIRDLEPLLGRIPDRTFAGWYVFGWGWGDEGTNEYPRQSSYRDFYLNDVEPINMEDVRETIVSSEAKAGELNQNKPASESEIWLFYNEKQLPIIAHWSLSDDATLVDTAPINAKVEADRGEAETGFYPVRADGQADKSQNLMKGILYNGDPNAAGNETTFDPSASNMSYYLRVDSDVEALDISLLASEPFRAGDIDMTQAGVTLSVRQAGNEGWSEYTLDKRILNDSVQTGTDIHGTPQYDIYNSFEYPMRSQWELGGGTIPLALSTGDDRYNEIKVTVTAPDGVSSNTYHFYIQRLNDPKLEQNPGNTPFGMIARDTGDVWTQLANSFGTSVEAEKEKAQERFRAERNFGKVDLYRPNGPENNKGLYNREDTYEIGAWSGEADVDLDETAIVVYQDSSFVDPGFTVIDSQGQRVTLDPGAEHVRRSVTLRLADDPEHGLTVSDIKDEAGTVCYYDGDGSMKPAAEADTFQVVRDENGQDRIDLRGVLVVPGIYQIEYTFTDPLTGKTYTSDPDAFLDVNRENAKTFCRTLVVLPIPGDVDMDGAVTTADAELLRRALDPSPGENDVPFLTGSDKVISLFKLRVCDVDRNGTVDGGDVALLQNGYTPILTKNTGSDYFYLPLPSGLSEAEATAWHARRELVVSTPVDKDKGKLSLEFLGVNTDEITADPELLNAATGEGQTVKRNDVFWVGVKVSDLEEVRQASDAASGRNKKAICGGITSINLTIAYDATYLEPALLPGGLSGDEAAQWQETLRRYNIGTNVENPTPFLWGRHYEIAGGTQADGEYTTHYSKAILPLERLVETPSNLRQMTISIRCTDTSYRVLNSPQGSTDEYYLVRVPFRLHTFPFGASTAQVLDIGLGMKELAMFSRLVPQDSSIPQVAAVWSTQDKIFGGSTWNLAEELYYVGGSARSINLGEDETVREDLFNFHGESRETVYGEPYKSKQLPSGLSGINDKLPRGLTYDETNGIISGIPEEVGIFEFLVVGGDGKRVIYRIQVEKAPLTLTAIGQKRYYGEPNDQLDYNYKQSDIKALDLFGGANYVPGFTNDGKSESLSKLAGYQAPELTTSVDQGADTGEYVISIGDATSGSGLANYAFQYADPEGTLAADGEKADSPLTVLPRPLVITKLEDDPNSPQNAMSGVKVWASDNQTVFAGQTAVYQKDRKSQFVPKDLGGSYEGLSLTGGPVFANDEVAVSFTATLTWEHPAPPHYDVPDGVASKRVDAAISAVTLEGAAARKNYVLVEPYLETRTASATVLNNPVVSLKVAGLPKIEGYTYGEVLLLYGLTVTLVYQDGSEVGYTYSSDESFQAPGIVLTWEDDKSSGPSRDDESHRLSNLQPMVAATHNGKYLCISAPGYWNGAVSPVRWYSDAAFTVAKKSLTLTALPKTVYYGEFGTAQDPKLTYTYDPSELSDEDQAFLKSTTGKTLLEGTEDELELLPGYVAPLLKARVGIGADEVTADTPAGNTYIISIGYQRDADNLITTGADNYSFRFQRGSIVAEWGENGFSSMIILPRPIVVTSLTLGLEGTTGKTFLYDDTSSLTLSRMYYADAEGTMVPHELTATGRDGSEAVDTFAAGLPENGHYYTAGNTGYVQIPYKLTGGAIHRRADGTLDEVVVRYSAVYTPDNPTAAPLSGTPYFNMPEGKTEKLADAEVRGLELVERAGDNRNYALVFDTQSAANGSKPKNEHAQGVVRLRELESVELLTPANRRDYVYGEELNLTGMSLRLRYKAEGDNALPQNDPIIDRTLEYSVRYSEGRKTDTFALQGMRLYWMDAGETLPEDLNTLTPDVLANLLGTAVNTGDYPDVATTGKKLMVCGRRDASQLLVWDETDDSAQYTVKKKSLPLTVEASNRYYGEPNGGYRAYYLFGALAAPDQKRLREEFTSVDYTGAADSAKLYVTADGTAGVTQAAGKDLSAPADSPELSFLDAGYAGVRFTTEGSRDAGRGRYAVSLDTAGSAMDNYVFDRNTASVLTVFRRPIVVDKVCETPISTIYFNTVETEFSSYAAQTGQKADYTTAGGIHTVLPDLIDGKYYRSMTDPEFISAVNAGMSWDLPLTGDAIYGIDTLGLGMTVVYPEVGHRAQIPDNQHQVDQPVTIQDMVLSEGMENYILVYKDDNDKYIQAPVDETATGRLDRRTIKKIELLQAPRMEYTYGEGLDLSKLKVRITYDALPGETYDPEEELFYQQCAGMLSVNYWDSTQLPADNDAGVQKRPAATGDHLTIAPDHTADRFVYNGEYLILTARAHTTTNYAKPVLVSDVTTNVPIPITVHPKDLAYTLTAAGKVYDGSRDALGAVTLTNPYVSDTGDKDVIFVATGAEYEVPDQNQSDPVYSDYTTLLGHLDTEGYTYESGGAGLTFTFFDPNVKYADERHTVDAPVAPDQWQSYWESLEHQPKTPESDSWDAYPATASLPVLVSGMALGGPDAANYTLDSAVELADNAADPTKDTVPYAVIEKAERTIPDDILPQVSVEVHTNAVKVTYPQEHTAVQDGGDAYGSELHYEYGLEYLAPPESGGDEVLTRWGGADTWQDAFYFGGEKETCPYPDGYEPNKEPEPPREGEVEKGQNYRWAEDGAHWYDAADTGLGTRDALPRNTVFWGVVRVAETHNYNASDPLSSSRDTDQEMADAQEDAQKRSETVQDWAVNRPSTDVDTDPEPTPAPAVQTYTQRLKLVSSTEETGKDGARYTVDTLEAVWFTDILQYEKKELLDAVVRNSDPTRYYGYYWDVDHSAELKFEEGGLDLSAPFSVEIDKKLPEGGTEKKEITVNEDGKADLYVNISSGGGGALYGTKIVITPGSVQANLGGKTVALTARILPEYALYEAMTWTSSDPNVVRVTGRGGLLFVGVGRATVTVTTPSGLKDSITVTVIDPAGVQQGVGMAAEELGEQVDLANSGFDFYFTKPFLSLDEDSYFYPDRLMDRAELVFTLARFYLAPEDWTWSGEVSFPDLTGEEEYAPAAELMLSTGVLTGLPDGTFSPGQVATRAEMAAILCRMIGLEPEDTKGRPHAFVDAGEEDTWAYPYIDALAKLGVLNGTGDNYFYPDRKITRAEAAAMLSRILLSGASYAQDGTLNVPADVPETHWGYGAILRAVNTVVLPKEYERLIPESK